MTQPLHIGLLGAMPEEVGSDLSHLKDLSCSHHGDLTIHKGVWGENIRLSLTRQVELFGFADRRSRELP